MDDQKVKSLVLTVVTLKLGAFKSMNENEFISLHYILKQKQKHRNLLALFGKTRSAPVKKLKGIATYCKENKNYQNHRDLEQVVLMNFGRTH